MITLLSWSYKPNGKPWPNNGYQCAKFDTILANTRGIFQEFDMPDKLKVVNTLSKEEVEINLPGRVSKDYMFKPYTAEDQTIELRFVGDGVRPSPGYYDEYASLGQKYKGEVYDPYLQSVVAWTENKLPISDSEMQVRGYKMISNIKPVIKDKY
jgi:hypothetical protein